MTPQRILRLRVSWVALLVTGLATVIFGLIVMVVRSPDEKYLRAIGVASIENWSLRCHDHRERL